MTQRPQVWGLTALMLFTVLLGAEFVAYSAALGLSGLSGNEAAHRLISAHGTAHISIFAHMIGGAAITVLAPLQLIPALRQRWPALHRWSGRMLVMMALIAGLGGLSYIALNGTVGGRPMDQAFAIYGALVLLAALQVIRHARARRFPQHFDWGVRLFFLSIASLMYRVHYGFWYATMGRTGTSGLEGGLTGWFDRINIWAFYLPYLFAVELALWRRGRGLFARRGPA